MNWNANAHAHVATSYVRFDDLRLTFATTDDANDDGGGGGDDDFNRNEINAIA